MKSTEQDKLSGVVEKFTVNKHDDIHGIVIRKDDHPEECHFPPHTARHIMDAVKEGDQVTITFHKEKPHAPEHPKPHHGPKHPKPHPKNEMATIKNMDSGTSVSIADFPAPKPADAATVSEFTIQHPELTRDKKGSVTGIVSDGRFFHIKPHEADTLEAELPGKKAVRIKAKKRLEHAGFVHAKGLEVYHLVSIDPAH